MSAWSDPAAVERLIALWKEGKSASQVANLLNREFARAGYSRASVIGKVHRLGLSGREKPAQPTGRVLRAPSVPRAPRQNAGLAFGTRTPKPMPSATCGRSASAQIPVDTAETRPISAGQSMPERSPGDMLSLRTFTPLPGCAPVPFGHGGCRWPTGGEGAEMTQCGARRADGEDSYCATHARAGRPPAATKDKLDRYLGIPRGRRAA